MICRISYWYLFVLHGHEESVSTEASGWATLYLPFWDRIPINLCFFCWFVCSVLHLHHLWALGSAKVVPCHQFCCDCNGDNVKMQPGVETRVENICISTFADDVVLLTSVIRPSVCTETVKQL